VALQLFHVQLRRRELAIRQALGASPAALGGLVLREGLSLAAWGTAFGLVAAGAAVRLLRSQLFGVDPLDPVTFAAIPLVLVAAVLAASWIPARRAASTDPAESLRSL